MPDQFGDPRVRVTLDTSELGSGYSYDFAHSYELMPRRVSSWEQAPVSVDDVRRIRSQERRRQLLQRTMEFARQRMLARNQRRQPGIIEEFAKQAVQNYVNRLLIRNPLLGALANQASGGRLANLFTAAGRASGAGGSGGAAAAGGMAALKKAGGVGAILAAAKFAWDYGPQGVTLWPTGLAAFQGAGIIKASPAVEAALESLRADFFNIKAQVAAIMPAMSYVADVTKAGLRIGGTTPNLIKLASDAHAIEADNQKYRMKIEAEINDDMAENLGKNFKRQFMNR